MKSENLNKGQNEFADKIMKGLEISFQKLLEFKKQKNSPLVVMRDGKIVKIMAEDFYKDAVKKDNLTYLSHEVMNLKEIPFAKLLAISDSTSEFLFELSDDEKYTNHLGTVAAAAQFSLAEFASGQWLIHAFPEYATQVIPVLRKSEVKFRKPAMGRVRARAIVNDESRDQFLTDLTQRKRALVTIVIELVNDDLEIVMSGTYEWFIQLQTPRNISNY